MLTKVPHPDQLHFNDAGLGIMVEFRSIDAGVSGSWLNVLFDPFMAIHGSVVDNLLMLTTFDSKDVYVRYTPCITEMPI